MRMRRSGTRAALLVVGAVLVVLCGTAGEAGAGEIVLFTASTDYAGGLLNSDNTTYGYSYPNDPVNQNLNIPGISAGVTLSSQTTGRRRDHEQWFAVCLLLGVALQAVPEPSSAILSAAGLLGVLGMAARRCAGRTAMNPPLDNRPDARAAEVSPLGPGRPDEFRTQALSPPTAEVSDELEVLPRPVGPVPARSRASEARQGAPPGAAPGERLAPVDGAGHHRVRGDVADVPAGLGGHRRRRQHLGDRV
jgi:hypothetical protein